MKNNLIKLFCFPWNLYCIIDDGFLDNLVWLFMWLIIALLLTYLIVIISLMLGLILEKVVISISIVVSIIISAIFTRYYPDMVEKLKKIRKKRIISGS